MERSKHYVGSGALGGHIEDSGVIMKKIVGIERIAFRLLPDDYFNSYVTKDRAYFKSKA